MSGPDNKASRYFQDLGAYLKRERELCELTQKEVADRIGIGGSRISNVENGKGTPSVDTLGLWLTALEIDPTAFGWRFDLFRQGKPLPAPGAEEGLADIVRPLVSALLREAGEKLFESS